MDDREIRERLAMMINTFQLTKKQSNVCAMREIVQSYCSVFSACSTVQFDEALTKYQQAGKVFFPYAAELYKYVEINVVNLYDWNRPGYIRQ